MKKSTTMFDFFKRKDSNSLEVNVGLPTTNILIPILENVGVSILENIHSPIPKYVNIPIPRNIHSPIPEYVNIPIPRNIHSQENTDISIPENNHISQIQFQKVDLDSLDYDPRTCKQI